MSTSSPVFQEPSADVSQESTAMGAEDDAATAPDKSTLDESALDEHAQKVIAAIRNDFKQERAKRQVAESALRRDLKAAMPKAAEYDRLAEASKSADERAQEALQAAENRALASMQRVARAEVKAALTGLVKNPDAHIKRMDLAQFIDDDGEINQSAIDELKATFQEEGFDKPRAPRPDQSQASGANGAAAASPQSIFGSILQSQLGSRG